MNTATDQILPIWRKVGYGLGNIGQCFSWVAVSSFFLIYCTNSLLINAGIVGTLILIAKLLDGIADLVMGRIIDKTNTRIGKARFWYLVSCVPVPILVYLIFNIPVSLSNTGKYIVIFIIYLLLSAVAYTMNAIAYNTMVALVTKNQKDQVNMSSLAMLFGMVGTVVVSSITMIMVESFGGWHMVSIIYGLLSFLFFLIPFFCLKELPADQHAAAQPGQGAHNINFFKATGLLIKNKYFVLVLLLYLFGNLSSGLVSTAGVYYATYVLHNSSLLGVLGLAMMVPMVIGLPFISKFVAKVGMQRACLLGNVVAISGYVISLFGNYLGLPVLLIGIAVTSIGGLAGAATYVPYVVKADEYGALKNGNYLTGTMFSCASIGIKVGSGIGSAVVGWILAATAFNSTAAQQTSSANFGIFAVYLILPLLCQIVIQFIYSKMNVEQEIEKLRGKTTVETVTPVGETISVS